MGESSQRSWRQRLGSVMAGVCAVLFVVTVGLWLHSHWYGDSIQCARNESPGHPQYRSSWLGITVAYGDLAANVGRIEVDDVKPSVFSSATQLAAFVQNNRGIHWSASAPFLTGEAPSDRVLGFSYDTNLMSSSGSGTWRGVDRTLSIPLALPAVLLALWPMIVLRRWCRTRVQKRIGLCRKCSYDLRASIERCPECGTAISTEPLPEKDLLSRIAGSAGWRLVACSLAVWAGAYWSWRYGMAAINVYYRDAVWPGRGSAASVWQWVGSGFWVCVAVAGVLQGVRAGMAMRRRRATRLRATILQRS